MPFRKEIKDTLRFLLLEVRAQLEDTERYLENPDSLSVEKITARDDYIDNLKGVIESKCFSRIVNIGEMDKPTVDLMKATVIIATNLERIGDYGVSMVEQTEYYKEPDFLLRYDFQSFFNIFDDTLDLILEALFTRDIEMGLQICDSELEIDEMYRNVFNSILDELRLGRNTRDLLTTIFIFRYLERVGDGLLNIGEAIISAGVGEKLKIHQFRALQEALRASNIDTPMSEFYFESIWETRSGCRIARIESKDGTRGGLRAIFKEGRLSKLEDEKNSIALWESLAPNLPPRVLGFQQHGENGSLLLEYFAGRTIKELLLGGDTVAARDALELVFETLNDIWSRTKREKPVNARHFKQLLARIEEVHRVHPEYADRADRIGHLTAPPLVELLGRAVDIEESLSAPFAVLVHGDMNIDNVIYSPSDRSVHFIDLHRSNYTDYVQDVSVFLISIFRLPEEEHLVRDRLNQFILDVYGFASRFAADNNDETFQARLTLGLIRSFASSTRFELKEEFAKSMYLRAVFLLEKILEHDGQPWQEFSLPRQALIY